MSRKNRYIFNQKAVVKGWLIKTFLLLLLLFVACGDGDEFMQFVHGGEDGEVVLTINTQLPSDGVSTRTAPTENITSITALAFNKNHELIKVQTEGVIKSTSSSTTGTFQIKVPVRTRRIHFIAKNNGVFDEITDIDYGKTDEELLVNRIGRINNSSHSEGILNALHYWQMLNFDRAEDLQDLSDELSELDKKPIKNDAGQDVYRLPLIRNMAKITLNLADGMTGHIAGVLNYNTTGTIVPYLKDEDGYKFGYQTDKNHELPESFVITSDVDECSELGLEHYLFEEYNDVGDLIYIMCFIDKVSTDEESGRFYKVALVKPSFTDDTDKYFYVIRNQEYKINVQSSLNKSYGIENYADAVQNAKPINDTAEEQVHLDFEPDEVYMFLGETGTCNITIPQGIEGLMIGFSKDRFNSDGISIKTTAGDVIGATKQETPDNAGIYVNTYNVKDYSEIVLSMNLKESVTEAIKDMEIQFQGTGGGKVVNDKLVVHVLKRGDLPVTPISTELSVTSGSSFTATVGPIPSYEGINKYELNVSNADGVFTVTPPNGLSAQDNGCYLVNAGSSYTFTFTLNKEGKPGDVYKLDYNLNTEYHDLAGSTIVTLVEEAKTVQIEATTQTTSLYYNTYQNSVSDLIVNVTVPKEVETLTFVSEHFTVMVAGKQGELVATNDSYAITHADNSTETIVPFRIRLNDGVNSQTASFTFSGTSNKQNVIVQPATANITLNSNGDANVRWQGNVPLNSADYTTIVPLKYEWFHDGTNFIPDGSKLNLEFTVTGGDTSWLEVFEIQGETSNDWTAYSFEELNNGNKYTATENGNVSLSLTLTDAIFEIIKDIFRSDFLGEDKIAFAIRGEGITLTKVSVGEVQTVALSARADRTSLYYSENAVSDLIVYVTIPAGVTTLNFESEYFDVVSVSGRQQNSEDENTRYITGTGPYTYTVNHRGETSLEGLYFRLRLKEGAKKTTSDARFTFSGTGAGVNVESAVVGGITLASDSSSDEYVRWQGDVLLEWNNEGHVTQIPLPYSWFEGLAAGSTLRVEYEVTDADKSEDNRDAVIQFTEVKSDSWTEYPYNFTELKENNSEGAGVNLSKNTQSGSIYNRGGVIELNLTQTILEQMESNRTTFEGLSDIVMAIQGGNVRLKKISVIPKADIPENAPLSKIELDFYSAENRDNNVYEDLLLGTSHLYLTATISAEDAAKYAGQSVTLVNTFSGNGYQYANSNGAIHWDDSSIDNNSNSNININSNGDATKLSFIVDANTTEYVIEWVFVTGQHYRGGDIGFAYSISTYTISDVDGTFNNFEGDTSATIGFTNEPIGLEIYSEADTDGGDDITIASGDELVMKATVPSDITAGTVIKLILDDSGNITNISWPENLEKSDIKVEIVNGWPEMTLTVVQDQRDYYLYWNPTVSGESRTATLSFTATIDDNSYNLNSVGNTSYSKTITVTPNNNQTTGTVVWNEGKTYTGWSTDYIAVNTYIPTGSVITIYTSSSSTNGGAFEMHDIEERSLRFTNVNYPVNDDNYYSVASGETSHSFTVTNETTANGNTLANGVDGLKINGNNVTITRIVVQYPSMTDEVFNRDFEDGSTITSVWGAEESKYVSQKNVEGDDRNNYLVLANATGGGFAQASLDRAYVLGNYTLTYRIKVASSDLSKSIKQEFQYFNNSQQIYERVSVDSKSVSLNTTDSWQEVTLDFEVTRGCNRLLFDYSDFIGEIYIDDLRLVKND